MASGRSWFKFWASAREDSKLRSLSDFEFRYWLLLLCLSTENRGDGTLDVTDKDEVCIDLGLFDDDGEPAVSVLESLVSKLARRKLVSVEDGVVTFAGWDRRQGKPSDRPEAVRKRVAKHRERQCNADVTPPVTPTEAEAEVEVEAERAGTRAGALPPCLSTAIEGTKWNSPVGKHDTPAQAFWANLESTKGGVISTTERMVFASIVSETCPQHCGGTSDEVGACLDVLDKAVAKTKGKPTPLFRRICEEDR